jgi:hypothetical protein
MKKLYIITMILMLVSTSFGQVGLYSTNIDSLETQDATTATFSQIERVGTSNFYAQTFKDADSDGMLYTFGCSATGAIDAAVTDSWEWAPATTLGGHTSEWADGYLILAYDDNGTGKVSSIAVNTSGAITKSFTSTYTYNVSAATSYPSIWRVPGTNYYILSYGLSTGSWIESLSIVNGVISSVDILKLTGLSSTIGFNSGVRISNTNYFLTTTASTGANNAKARTFEMNVTNGALGDVCIDSVAIIQPTTARRFFAFAVNDSLQKSTSSYYGTYIISNSNYPYITTYEINKSNGDILGYIDQYTVASSLTTAGSGAGIRMGDRWWMFNGGARTFELMNIKKSDADIVTAFGDYDYQYGPTTSSGLDMLLLSQSDSTFYVLYSLGGASSDAFVHSFSVKGGMYVAGRPGKIGSAMIDTVMVGSAGIVPAKAVRMGDNGAYWAVGYIGSDSDSHLKSFSCTNTGDLSAATDSITIATSGTCTEMGAVYTGGDFVGLVYEQNTLGTIASIAVSSTTGDVGASATASLLLAGGDIIAPMIYRIQTTNWYSCVYGINAAGTASDAGWLKTYSINSSTGALGPSGTTTIKAQDSLKITTGFFNSTASMTRVGSSDYYALLTESTAAGTYKIYTIDINSTTGNIGNAWVDSLTIATGKTSGTSSKSNIARLGSVNNYYLAQMPSSSGTYWATVGISAADGTIDAAVTDSYDNTSISSNPSQFVAMGGDIYGYTVAGTGSDGYLRTVEVDDTTGKFIPSITKAVRDEVEFQPIQGYAGSGGGRLSYVESSSYQTAYYLFLYQSSKGLYLGTTYVLGERDQFGWSHKIWGITPSKVWGSAAGLVKKVFGI